MKEKILLRRFKDQQTERIPIWFLRQAGRYLPEYRQLKEKAGGFLQMCTNPKLAAEISIQPIKRFDLDAIIFFCDILTPLIPMGIQLDFVPQPVIFNSIKNRKDIKNLKDLNPDLDLGYVKDTLHRIKEKMPKEKTLIGFGGSPFTLASYLVKKKKEQNALSIKKFCFTYPEDYQLLMEKLSENSYRYLLYQIESGAEVIQIFDSWAGCFTEQDYRKYVLEFVQQLIIKLKKKSSTPIIYYINGGSHLSSAMLETGADALSLDYKIDVPMLVDKIKKRKKRILLQGNLDPLWLFSTKSILKEKIHKIAESFGNHPWVFNVGEGLNKETPIENLEYVIEEVKKIKNEK